jgi:hypothetical protein
MARAHQERKQIRRHRRDIDPSRMNEIDYEETLSGIPEWTPKERKEAGPFLNRTRNSMEIDLSQEHAWATQHEQATSS